MNPYRVPGIPTAVERLAAAYAAWFKERWPTGWWAAWRLDHEQIMRDAFEGGYRAGLEARASAFLTSANDPRARAHHQRTEDAAERDGSRGSP